MLVVHARSLYVACATSKTVDVLAGVERVKLNDYDRLEALGLVLDAAADLLCLDEALRTKTEAYARQWFDVVSATAPPALATIARQWIEARFQRHHGRRDTFTVAHNEIVARLRPLAYSEDREAARAFCRFQLEAASAWLDFGDTARAQQALHEAQALIQIRRDLSAPLLAELHGCRARMLACDAVTFPRWRNERDAAQALAQEYSLTRTTWLCMYLDIAVSVACKNMDIAHFTASGLLESVRASDSAAWQRIAAYAYTRASAQAASLDDLPFEFHCYANLFDEIARASSSPFDSIANECALPELTPRQREIAAFVAQGLKDHEIAERLSISHRTVGNHLNAVFEHYSVHSRLELAERLSET